MPSKIIIPRLSILGGLIIALSGQACGSMAPSELKACGEGSVIHVETGDRFILDNRSLVSLESIKAPTLYEDRSAYSSWPYARQSKTVLENMILNKHVTLYCKPNRDTTDRFGRIKAQAYIKDTDIWIQRNMVRAGAAFIYGGNLEREKLHELFILERTSRKNKTGLWALPTYAPISAQATNWKTGWFQFVEGKVKSTAEVRGTLYLNFGDDWRTDFTVQMSRKIAKRYQKEGLDPYALTGKNIEVRGFLEWAAGPKIIVTNKNQIALTNDQGDLQ